MDHPQRLLRKLATPGAAVPKLEPAKGFEQADSIKALFFDGLPFQGKPTKVFAWIGVPEISREQAVPGMVLVHGGGGSAFAEWVRLWNSRGYAAIAMDLSGCVPTGEYDKWPEHEHPGPVGILSRANPSVFEQIDRPIEDQWPFHAVADVLMAHTILRNTPGVDPNRIGITGISWGGWTTCLASSIDARFKLAVPVYGCGFVHEDSVWVRDGHFQRLGPQRAARWAALWDPSNWLPDNPHPMLWINGTNDFAYPMSSWQKSYRLPKGDRVVVCPVRMPHGHGGPGENPEEIHAFVNEQLTRGAKLARFVSAGADEGGVRATFDGEGKIVRAELNYTLETKWWPERLWQTVPAEWDRQTFTARAALPPACHAYYFNVFDAQGRIVSSEHVAV